MIQRLNNNRNRVYGNQTQTHVGFLKTPITSSLVSIKYLQNLPAYRRLGASRTYLGRLSILRGLEIGLAHGYFLIGPFFKLSPLRSAPSALLIGCLATIGLSIILNIGMVIYGFVMFNSEEFQNTKIETEIRVTVQDSHRWKKFSSGIFIGLWSGCMFATLLIETMGGNNGFNL